MVNLSGEATKQWLEEEFSKSCCSLLIIISTDNLPQLVISIEQTLQLSVILELLNYLVMHKIRTNTWTSCKCNSLYIILFLLKGIWLRGRGEWTFLFLLDIKEALDSCYSFRLVECTRDC